MIEPLDLPGVMLITPPRFADSRGWFSETWNQARLAALGFTETFVQEAGRDPELAPVGGGELGGGVAAEAGRAVADVGQIRISASAPCRTRSDTGPD